MITIPQGEEFEEELFYDIVQFHVLFTSGGS